MILHHFTSQICINRIKGEGIKHGKVPWQLRPDGKIFFMPGLQWLTQEEDFDKQDWAEPFMHADIPVRRTDYRLTVAFPDLVQWKVKTWEEFAAHHNLPVREYFNTFPGRKWWYVYIGRSIPPSWIIECHKNPTLFNIADHREL